MSKSWQDELHIKPSCSHTPITKKTKITTETKHKCIKHNYEYSMTGGG